MDIPRMGLAGPKRFLPIRFVIGCNQYATGLVFDAELAQGFFDFFLADKRVWLGQKPHVFLIFEEGLDVGSAEVEDIGFAAEHLLGPGLDAV